MATRTEITAKYARAYRSSSRLERSRLLDALQQHGELKEGGRGYDAGMRAELLAMSPATIDRYLAAAKARGALKGISATKPGTLLRNSITVRKAGDEVEAEPGFFEADTVAHCGPTLKGEFARTVNLTDVVTGWDFTTAIRNNARVHMLGALERAVSTIPFEVAGLDCDNGSEFINHEMIGWATTATGKRRRIYDNPRTPLDRLLATKTLSPAQAAQLQARRAAINPAELARDIQRIQNKLTGLAKRHTEDLADSLVKPLPDTSRGVRTRRTA